MDDALRQSAAAETPRVRRVPATQALEWLRHGYLDLTRSGWPSLAYGAFVSIFGMLLLALAWGSSYLVPALIGGFLLVAPFAAIVFVLSYGGNVPNLSTVARDVLFTGDYLPLLLSFFGLGASFAVMVFTLSVVSIPMLLDRPVEPVTAAITSMRCCLANPGAMALWATVIAGLTLIGFATGMLGLFVIFPWLAHATWRAYRDLVA